MKNYFSRKFKSLKAFFNRAHKGFTLIETLITVGILAILLAVSIPGVITIQKNLKMQELDDIARQIFLSAQGELTEMKSSGRLETFIKELNAPAYTNQNLGTLNKRPSDYDKIGTDSKWKEFYYLNAADEIMEKHIIRKVSSLGAYLEGGSFIVELNPKTGDVYGVFYSQKPTITYSYIIDPANVPNRGRDDRVAAQLGYYGGEAGSSASSTLPAYFFPQIEVINDEDLYLKFSCSNLQAVLRNPGSLTITITATDEDGIPTEGSDWQKTLIGVTDFRIDATGNTTCYILLDSLRTNENFAEITGGKLKAGDNITVTATLDYDNGIDPAITSEKAETNFNSLFGSKKVDAVTGETQIDISKLRHLNNLRGSIYKENLPTGKIKLNQSLSIDFDVKNWANSAVMPTKQKPTLASFSAIANKALLERGVGAEITYTGDGNSLLSFPLTAATSTSTENVGLFATAKNMTFNGMRLIDFSVNNTAYNNVGMLVGTLEDGTVTDVRAHLSTKDLNGNHHGNKMPDRLAKYNINAKENVGGLIGLASGTTNIEGSFAAVPITATKNVGGLVGSFAGGTITNSYGSGNIIASSHAGGLVGLITGSANVTSCYSTSNVTADSHAGGLVGQTTGGAASTFTNGRSYGLVIKKDNTIDNNTSGGFVGNQAIPNTYTDCKYLQQGTYNNYTNTNRGTPTGHSNLLYETPNSDINSHPYLSELFGKAFPFPMLKTGTGVNEKLLEHYGDWVEATTMQTSLVYYEQYADGTYGYYAKTSLSTIGGVAEDAANLWEINTLKNNPCIEDGYALMTIFQLSEFNYKLENGAVQKITTVDKVENITDFKAQVPLLQEDVTVHFKKDELTQEIKNARVYRLPFHLQVAERTGDTIKNFFLKLNINGYVGKGEDKKIVIDNFNFYYCPDFAKNAVNPELGNTNINYPKDPTGADNPVYVRSPRQLNGLSRYNYYWNDVNSGKRFYFLQETELNYKNYVKTYCGVTFDLMNTDKQNLYRNRPIGRPAGKVGSQFRNIYDGNYKKIIDYRCETYELTIINGVTIDSSQYTGLFGEVYKCTLKNIIMEASSPGDEGVPSSAYIKSHFRESDNPSGTGALVGLVYVEDRDLYDGTQAKIENCFVSGYDIITTEKLPDGSAVGGLVGYNYGYIENSSANSKTVVAGNNGNKACFLGGLVGSLNGRGRIENCYAGGVLKSTSNKAEVGGLVAGFRDIPGYGRNNPNIRHQRVENSYSHCTWSDTSYLKNGTFYPCVPKTDKFTVMNCYYLTNSIGIDMKRFDTRTDPSTGKSYEELREMAAKPSATELSAFGKAANSYAWSAELKPKSYPFPAIVKNGSGQFVHYGDWYVSDIDVPTAIVTYYEQYQDDKTKAVSYGYQFAETAGIKAYSGLQDNTYDITEAGYGVLVLEKEDSLADVWVNGIKVTRNTSTGTYTAEGGVYSLFPLNLTDVDTALPDKGANVVLQYNKISNGVSEKDTQGLYVNFNFAATVSLNQLVSTSASPTQVRTERQLRNLDKLNSGYYKMTHNIVIKNYDGNATGNLTNNGYTFDGGYKAGGGGVQYLAYSDRVVGKDGNYIFGLKTTATPLTKPTDIAKAALFSENHGTVKNVALVGVNVGDEADYAAALVFENFKTVQDCFAQGDVTGNMVAAGLVYSNNSSGTIQNSYFNGNVTAGLYPAGFVYTNTNTASISNCYAVGEVSSVGSGAAAGFVNTNNGNISNTYSAMKVTSGGNKSGFAASIGGAAKFTKCYWLKDVGKKINDTLLSNDGKGTSMNVNFMRVSLWGYINSLDINNNNIWAIGRTAYPFPDTNNGSKYPYPSLASQDFYGNWWT